MSGSAPLARNTNYVQTVRESKEINHVQMSLQRIKQDRNEDKSFFNHCVLGFLSVVYFASSAPTYIT